MNQTEYRVHGVRVERFMPLIPVQGFVTLAEYFKQKLRAGLRERHIAEFVDDEQFDGGELRLSFRRRRSSRASIN